MEELQFEHKLNDQDTQNVWNLKLYCKIDIVIFLQEFSSPSGYDSKAVWRAGAAQEPM
jgi:hypothetical protein